MNKRYNIALRPTTKGDAITTLANTLSPLADKYILGSHSLPHVTLYQFQAEEGDIESLWNNICNSIETSSIILAFTEFSFITFDNSIFWISLLPDQSDQINKMHKKIAIILEKQAKTNFDPHMTLINTRNKEYQNIGIETVKKYKPITDCFQLSLGLSDEIGQYLKDIHYIKK